MEVAVAADSFITVVPDPVIALLFFISSSLYLFMVLVVIQCYSRRFGLTVAASTTVGRHWPSPGDGSRWCCHFSCSSFDLEH